jgi:hypothetical protein
MTTDQKEMYYGMLAAQTGQNAVSRMLDGNINDAVEIAIGAAKFAFAAYPELRN